MSAGCRGSIDHIRLGPTEEDYQRWEVERSEAIDKFVEKVLKDTGETDMSTLRYKMRVQSVSHFLNEDGSTSQEEVNLSAVYGADGTDNAQWSKWTPSAQFKITINNPGAFNKLSKGHEFYVDFTPVETVTERAVST